MTTIRERIIENRPNLTLSSIKTYMSIINKTARDINGKLEKPDDIIEHHKEILESLMTYKPNIRKTKLSAFIVVLDQKDDTPDDVKEIIDNYRKQLFADADDVDKDEKKQKLTESQEKNYITWDEVLKIYENLRTEAEPLFKLENLNKKQYNKLQEFVLLSLYVLTPPRRSLDYAQFKIKSIDESTDNYMTVKGRKKEGTLVFNAYKNSKRLGKQEVKISNALRNIIQKWMLKNPNEYLITTNTGNRIEQPRVNLMLNNIFNKNIGSSLLRHIYLTHKYGDVDLEEMEKTTHEMGNSEIERTLKYVKKNEQPDD
jgi:integrase